MEVKCLEPIADKQSKILILGTMPGVSSLQAGQYYNHQDNLFWDIIFRVCRHDWKIDELVSDDYETKKNLLLTNRIALWDVLKQCERKGSSDKNIINFFHNDFISFFQDHPNIQTVFFNGKEASKYFNKYKSEFPISDKISFIQLRSTSSMDSKNSFYKLKEWLQIRNYLTN